ncbi:uncharacterized protein FMAN_14084 [Fusarium mangiferae]|uniref:Uncharacterized protein n=1 Tax=Fusarium mangiferae TaxID=192010 RepID=A0A1L7TE91_FUSMA|nr:uncharacterized protein FMAN_14084 [Fusarium mangiferae]CVK96259.1 uncharacterized protein FMAN_14084 [Fusarium mangiferae]
MSHCQYQEGTETLYTYELSNMDSIASVTSPKSGGLRLEKFVFAQCGPVTGPVMSFNCASIAGGSLTIGITSSTPRPQVRRSKFLAGITVSSLSPTNSTDTLGEFDVSFFSEAEVFDSKNSPSCPPRPNRPMDFQ